MCVQGCWHAGNVWPNAKTVRGSAKMPVMCVQMPTLFDSTFDAGNACPNAKVSAECKDAGNVCPTAKAGAIMCTQMPRHREGVQRCR